MQDSLLLQLLILLVVDGTAVGKDRTSHEANLDLNQACVRLSADVRFGSLADIFTSPRHVRFTPNNGRWAAHPSQRLAVGL
jgi:hypothetical protein